MGQASHEIIVHCPEIIVPLWLRMSFRSSHWAIFLSPLAALSVLFPAVFRSIGVLCSALSMQRKILPLLRLLVGIGIVHSVGCLYFVNSPACDAGISHPLCPLFRIPSESSLLSARVVRLAFLFLFLPFRGILSLRIYEKKSCQPLVVRSLFLGCWLVVTLPSAYCRFTCHFPANYVPFTV